MSKSASISIFLKFHFSFIYFKSSFSIYLVYQNFPIKPIENCNFHFRKIVDYIELNWHGTLLSPRDWLSRSHYRVTGKQVFFKNDVSFSGKVKSINQTKRRKNINTLTKIFYINLNPKWRPLFINKSWKIRLPVLFTLSLSFYWQEEHVCSSFFGTCLLKKGGKINAKDDTQIVVVIESEILPFTLL